MVTHIEDIWECSKCGDIKGRHDQYFDGVCEHCTKSCSTCSLGQTIGCDLGLEEECVTNTGDERHKDYWIDAKEGEDE